MAEIAVVNNSTLVKDADVATMCEAINDQIILDCAPAWSKKAVPVKFYSDASKVPLWAWELHIIDSDAQVAGALGYHQEDGTRIDGYIMAQPILDNGGSILTFDSNNPNQYTVSGTLSHEAIECWGDVYANYWAVNTNSTEQYNLFAVELADPVESYSYSRTANGQNVSLSNFIYPSWTNPQATEALNAPFDHLGRLKAPFTLDEGGYYIVATINNEQQVQASRIFHPAMPEWRKAQKLGKVSRGMRRGMKK